MSENNPAKEWGLADWRDVGSYTNAFGRPDEWSDDRWRWEFKRRLPGYRAAFDKYVEQGCEGTIVQDHVEEANSDGQRVMVSPGGAEPALWDKSDHLGFMFVADEEEREQFRMHFLPNPRFSDQPNQALHFDDRLSTAQRDEDGRLIGEVTYHFDLMEPLNPQLARCKKLLKFHQHQLKNAKTQRRWYRDYFLEYLQALDARECGASYSEIMVYIPLNKKTTSAAKALVEQACQVQDNF